LSSRVKEFKLHNIIFVCDGNICRSPIAEALLKQKLSHRGVSGVNVASCGLRVHRDAIHPNLAVLLGDAYENLRGVAPRPISEEIVGKADLILAMEERQVHEILSRFPLAKGKVATVTTFAGEKGEIEDFVDGGQETILDWMKKCLVALEKNTDKIADEAGHLV
jgi:protein-tyrosine-phosphatase